MLTDLFENFYKRYFSNKNILKDLQFKTISLFMENFMEDIFNDKIYKILNSSENTENVEIFKFLDSKINILTKEDNLIDNSTTKENNDEEIIKFDNEDKFFSSFIIENLKEKIFLKIIFYHKILFILEKINLKKNNFIYTNKNNSEIIKFSFYFFYKIIQEFSNPNYILLNVKIFKFIFSKIFKNLFTLTEIQIQENQEATNLLFFQNFLEFFQSNNKNFINIQNLFYTQELNNNIIIEFTNLQKNILNLILLNFLCKKNPNFIIKNFFINSNSNQKKIFEDLLQFIFTSFNNIKNQLTTHSESLVNKINNDIITIFKGFWFNLEKSKISGFDITNSLLENLNKNINLISENYEVYIFIYDFYFKNFLTEKFFPLNKKNVEDILNNQEKLTKLKLMKSILENNTPSLHRFALGFLKNTSGNLKACKIKIFLDKFLMIYDVLDGFNSHLFKQLVNELIFLVEYCEKDSTELNYCEELDIFYYKENNLNSTFLDFFKIPINYFYFLANKIFSHENSRIQKFFIKTFSNLAKEKKLKNKNFEIFLYKIFMKSINNPLFYPENENIAYHTKLGVVIENLFSAWLKNILIHENKKRFLENFEKFLYGIGNYIELKRILVYLLNVIRNIFYEEFYEKKTKFYLEGENKNEIYIVEKNFNFSSTEKKEENFCLIFLNILKNINLIISKHFKFLTFYNKNSSWESICLILFEVDLFPFDIKRDEEIKESFIISAMEIEFFKFSEFFLDYYIYRENSNSLFNSEKDIIFNTNNKKYYKKILDKNFIFRNFLEKFLLVFSNNQKNMLIMNDLLSKFNLNTVISLEILEKFQKNFSLKISQEKNYELENYNNLPICLFEKIIPICVFLSVKKNLNSFFHFSLQNFFEEYFTKLIFSSYISENEKLFISKIFLNFMDLINIVEENYVIFPSNYNLDNKMSEIPRASFNNQEISNKFLENNVINPLEIINNIILNLNQLKNSSLNILFGEKNYEDSDNNSCKNNFNFIAFENNTQNLFINFNSVENKFIMNNFIIFEKIIFKNIDLIFSCYNEDNKNNILIKELYSIINKSLTTLVIDFNQISYLLNIYKNLSEEKNFIKNNFLNCFLVNFEYLTKYALLLEIINFIFWKKIFEIKKLHKNNSSAKLEFSNEIDLKNIEENILEKLDKFYNIIENFLIINEKSITKNSISSENKQTNSNRLNTYTCIRSNLIKIKYFLLSSLNLTIDYVIFKNSLKKVLNLSETTKKEIVKININPLIINSLFFFNRKKNIQKNQYNHKSNPEKNNHFPNEICIGKTEEIIKQKYSDSMNLNSYIKNNLKNSELNSNENKSDNFYNKENLSENEFDLFYLENLSEYLDKCSEDTINYIFDLISFGTNKFDLIYSDELFQYLKTLKNLGMNLIIDKRENLNYINIKSYMKIFIKKNLFKNENYKNFILFDLIKTITELNEKRTWLLIKILTEELINLIYHEKLNLSILKGLEENIMDLAESKETRGDDSYMLKVIPNFLYCPFNYNKNFSKFSELNFLKLDISKYGFYIRMSIAKLFENLINSIDVNLFENISLEKNQENKFNISDNNSCIHKILYDIEFILDLILKILLFIDKASSGKSEMQFTTKHRRKLRLSQFLVILSKIFLNIKKNFIINLPIYNNDTDQEISHLYTSCDLIIKEIEKTNIKIFEKINLHSVKFYLDLFSLNLCYSSENFFKYLLNNLENPQSKTHCVSSSMIILSIFFLENLEKEKKNFYKIKNKFEEFFYVLISLCTSNICNIRGFAQFFIFKFNQILFEENSEKIMDLSFTFPKIFMNFLNTNTNIQKFFKKFDENFIKFLDIYNNFSYENIISKNFDEINCEIIPQDILSEFRELGMKMIKLENEDFSKATISWKWALCPELMESVLQAEKLGMKKTQKLNLECNENIKLLLNSENDLIKKKDIQNNLNDFQKKYRPGENLDSKNNLNQNYYTENKEINENENSTGIDYNLENIPEMKKIKRKRLDIVVMASLIDKAPNLGGLARTCEVFNLGCMTICSEAYLNDNAFLTAAASAEKWLPLINLASCDIEIFLISYKKLGYKIIGLEQTANSISLRDFKFSEKIVIVLGNEKEGIPQNIINLIDYCVIIPQFGEIRSLNVHVSAALMLWEIVNSINK